MILHTARMLDNGDFEANNVRMRTSAEQRDFTSEC